MGLLGPLQGENQPSPAHQVMEKMEVDNDIVVDLSVSHTPQPQFNNNTIRRSDYSILLNSHDSSSSRARRILRPRAEPRRFIESPDAALNGTSCKPRTNGTIDSDSSEGEMPPLLPITELSPSEIWQREKGLRRLREELRAEEMKLVLLKKLRQSQQLKENLATVPPVVPPQVLPPTGLPSGLSITPTTVKLSSKTQQPQAAHTRFTSNSSTISISATNSKPTNLSNVPPLLRGQPPPARSLLHAPQLSNTTISATSIRGMAANLSVPQPQQRSSLNRSSFPAGVKDLSPAVTITPAPPQTIKPASTLENKGPGSTPLPAPVATPLPSALEPQQETPQRPREDTQTPAQRQAAAKSALRKQLEKTLLQIPPPKPPPPEMHFIPNPSNTEFIYLVGLEHVVDFLTKEARPPAPPTPFQCQQCRADFTPVWKWEKQNKNRQQSNATFQQPTLHGKDPRVICEQCVTSNVKKSLKTEHTNRLKTAFVKALQQEQEIEQRLAQVSCNSPAPSPVAPEPSPSPKSAPTPTPRHAATPPAPPPTQPTPPPSRQSHSSSHSTPSHTSNVGGSSSAASSSSQIAQHVAQLSAAAVAHAANSHAAQQQSQQQQDKFHQSAAAMQAIQQQLFRGLSPQHMLPFSPLFYPYMAIAQAAQAGNGGKASSNANAFAEMQRAADLQRQYLLDMIPPPSGQSRHNWKT